MRKVLEENLEGKKKVEKFRCGAKNCGKLFESDQYFYTINLIPYDFCPVCESYSYFSNTRQFLKD